MDVDSTYRRDDVAVREQVEELAAERRSEARALDATARPVLARRTGRAAAGAVGIAGGLTMLGLAASRAFEGPPTWFLVHMGSNDGALVGILLGSWVAMGIAYVLGQIVGKAQLDRALADAPARSGRPHEELERVRAAGPRRAAVAGLLARVCNASVGWPLAAMALLLPLTLHLVVWAPGSPGQWSDFETWIRMSAVHVGLAHLVLAGWSLRLGARLEGLTAPAVGATSQGWAALGLTTLASLLPGVVLFGVPVLLTAVTGVCFIPLSFHLAGKRLAEERAALEPLWATPA